MEDTIILDVRTPQECNYERIIGAIEIPLATMRGKQKTISKLLGGKDTTIICSNGKRSEIAKDLIINHTHSNILIYEGGIEAFKKEFPNKVVQGGIGCRIEILKQVQIFQGLLLLLFVGLSISVSPLFIIGVILLGIGLIYSGTTGICYVARILSKLSLNKGNSL